MSDKAKKVQLVGCWFHSFSAENVVEWQGQVVSRVDDTFYLVQLFEWISGDPGCLQIVPVEKMIDWFFYETNDAMIFSYEYGAVSNRRQDRTSNRQSNNTEDDGDEDCLR